MKRLILIFFVFSFISGCDLNEQVLDTPVGENALKGPNTLESALAPVYANYRELYGVQDQLLNLQSIASDEGIVPFRGGTDWYDGGRYINIHKHEWTSRSQNVESVWAELSKGIAKAAYAQQVANDKSNSPDVGRYKAEAQALGAFYNQVLLDLYGVAGEKKPEDVEGEELSKIYRKEDAVKYIANEYSKAESNLGSYNSVGTTRFTKAASWAFKARLYLNKPVYVDEYADEFDFKDQDMDSVIQYTTRVINTGDYSLGSDYFSIWDVDNHDNKEIIFAFNQSIANNGSNRLAYFPASRATHGSLTNLSAQGTDAYALTSRMYHMWDGHHSDPRFHKDVLPDSGTVKDADYGLDRGIQVGQQYGIVLNDAGDGYKRAPNGELIIEPLVDYPRSGDPVNYTIDVGLTENNGQVDGTRPFKFEYDPKSKTHTPGRVDIPVMRYADVYLMRAEAYLRKGKSGMAMQDINKVRNARGAEPIVSVDNVDLKRMELERIFEFYFEFQRRRDQIRFGNYEDKWTDKTNDDPTRRLYPIPQKTIDAASAKSGYLEQNEGY